MDFLLYRSFLGLSTIQKSSQACFPAKNRFANPAADARSCLLSILKGQEPFHEKQSINLIAHERETSYNLEDCSGPFMRISCNYEMNWQLIRQIQNKALDAEVFLSEREERAGPHSDGPFHLSGSCAHCRMHVHSFSTWAQLSGAFNHVPRPHLE